MLSTIPPSLGGLDRQNQKNRVKNKLASLHVVPLGKALSSLVLSTIPPSLCGIDRWPATLK